MADINNTITPPDLSVLLDQVKKDVFLGMNCVKIGTIQSFDASTQLATIKISINQVTEIDESNIRTVVEYPLLAECPVMILQGGGDYISFPIKSGDNCVVVFNDRQIDEWLNVGDGQPPTIGRLHDLSDGIAFVGINPLTKTLAGIIEDGIRLSHNGDSASVELKDAIIESIAALFKHNGSMEVTENMDIGGDINVIGEFSSGGGGSVSGDLDVNGRIDGNTIHADNGANGTFTSVTVVDGIVISGS